MTSAQRLTSGRGSPQKFQATVFGTSDTAVAWSVQEATGGSVDADGTYTAPATAGTYHVVATSHADPTKSSAAAVSVSVPSVIARTPSTAALQTGASLKFQASVSGTKDTVVAWSVQEANGGSIAADGTYTAPTTSGTYHVTATSHADPGKSGSATVTVTGSVAPIVTITASPPSLTNQTGSPCNTALTNAMIPNVSRNSRRVRMTLLTNRKIWAKP